MILANQDGQVAATKKFAVGDVLRAHTNGGATRGGDGKFGVILLVKL